MKSVEKRGKSIEEAVAMALLELGAKEADVTIEILEEPSKGLLGFIGSKGARVKVSLKETRPEAAERFLREVTEAMGVHASRISTEVQDGYAFINLEGKDLGILIGRRGQTLNALQYLVNLAAAKGTVGNERIVLDVGGYRKRREESLRILARRIAEKVRRTGRNIALEPMSAQERRIIHTALHGHPYVTTRSEGEEPYRKVVIISKK